MQKSLSTRTTFSGNSRTSFSAINEIRITGLLPDPLKDRLQRRSQIWQQEYVFQKGYYYQIYSPSGQGKSTFIHILYGLRRDYTGQVYFGSCPLHTLNFADWSYIRRQHLAIVFQDLRLLPELTAWQNLQLKAALYHTDSYEIQAMAAQLGVEHRLGHTVAQLSYGERQRIAIIRALIQPFDFLLLDEPFSHLDKANVQQAVELILARCARQEAGLILTSLGYDYQITFQEKLLLA